MDNFGEKGSDFGEKTDFKPGRNWVLTVPAGEKDGVPTVGVSTMTACLNEVSNTADWVFQLERGEQSTEKNADGYLHYQVCLLLDRNSARNVSSLQKAFQDHGVVIGKALKVKKNNIAAARYCSKNDTREVGPFWSSPSFEQKMRGGVSRQGQRVDLERIRKALDAGSTVDDLMLSPDTADWMSSSFALQYAERYFNARRFAGADRKQRDITIHYVWGKTGSGKSRSVYDKYSYDDIYVAHLGSRDPFASYAGQPVLVLDEFRSQIEISDLLQMTDRYPYEIDARYHNKWACWTTIYILSNWSLEQQYSHASDDDRAALRRRITDITCMNERSVVATDKMMDELFKEA